MPSETKDQPQIAIPDDTLSPQDQQVAEDHSLAPTRYTLETKPQRQPGKLRRIGRSIIGTFRRQRTAGSTDTQLTQTAPEDNPDVESWTEDTYFPDRREEAVKIEKQEPSPARVLAQAPSFSETVRSANEGMRNQIVRYRDEQDRGGAVHETTEGDMILELDQFLDRAQQAATEKGDIELAENLGRSRDELPFLDSEVFAQATKLIVDDWQTYLDEDPNRRVFIVFPQLMDDKSNTYVSNALLAEAHNQERKLDQRVIPLRTNQDLRTKLIGISANDARLAFADDWVGNGKQAHDAMGEFAESLITIARRTDLVNRLELDLLAASSGQTKIPRYLGIGKDDFPIKSLVALQYPGSYNPHTFGVMDPFGAHGSNDRNHNKFENLAALIRGQTGDTVRVPRATYIESPYKKPLSDDDEVSATHS